MYCAVVTTLLACRYPATRSRCWGTRPTSLSNLATFLLGIYELLHDLATGLYVSVPFVLATGIWLHLLMLAYTSIGISDSNDGLDSWRSVRL